MKVVVASANPIKLKAVREAFDRQFPDSDIQYETVIVPSGVSEQPFSDAETRRGARNRAGNASAEIPHAEFWVGLEGGLERIDDQLMAFAWMSIKGRDGQVGEARTVTLPLPPAVRQLVDEGLELGEANDRVFSTINSKQAGGAYGLLTNGQYSRGGVYAQALTIALVPFVNELFSHTCRQRT